MPTDQPTTAERSLALTGAPDPLSGPLPGGDSPQAANPAFATSASGRRIAPLSGRQKAAILVRLLLDEGADLQLSHLPESQQAALTEEIARMRLVDRETVSTVAREFVETLEQVGLSFSGGIEGALAVLGERLSPEAAEQLKQRAHTDGHANPWERITAADPNVLIELLEAEAEEVAAVVLTKLPVARAAALLGKMPGERARRVACVMKLTESIAPTAVARIGKALVRQLYARPRSAFPATPGERFGAILNEAAAATRDSLLAELHERDAEFAAAVRRNILTFGQLHERLKPRDVPKSLRDIGQDELVTALAFGLQAADSPEAVTANFLLENMSQRVASALRDEIELSDAVPLREGEAAQTAIVNRVRALIDTGDISLLALSDEP